MLQQQQQQQSYTSMAFPSTGDEHDDLHCFGSFLCNYHDYDYNYFNHPFSGGATNNNIDNNNNNNKEIKQRKTRLTSDQIEVLENSFQEEVEMKQLADPAKKIKVKLGQDRKICLARELGLHPRQVGIWFQNRRARLKGKQLEQHYNALKQEFDIISQENHNLQQEVMKLKAKLHDFATLENQLGCTRLIKEAPVEENVIESTSNVAIPCSSCCIQVTSSGQNIVEAGSDFFSTDDYFSTTTTSLPYWGVSPGTYP